MAADELARYMPATTGPHFKLFTTRTDTFGTLTGEYRNMETLKCIKERMSIRKFKKEEVPTELLEKVIDAARHSPSYKNSQPWNVIVLSGQKKKELSDMLVELYESGAAPTPDLPAPESWPPPEEKRISDLFRKRKEATGIDLSAPDIVAKTKKANFQFYGAPHAMYLYQHSSLSSWSLFDIGLFAQTLMLAAHDLGLGTVPQAFATDYAAQTKEFLGIPSDMRLVLGISIGWPDMESPVNSMKTDRAPVEEIAAFVQ